MKNYENNIMVIWVTGLSGAGKTTFARKLCAILRNELEGVVHLDGDELRQIFGKQTAGSYLRESRIELAKAYGKLANSLSSQGLIVIISTISLFKEIHNWNRKYINDYIEILLNPPLGILKKRDQKNLYSDYENKVQKNIIGLDIDFDLPTTHNFHFTEVGEAELHQVAQKVVKNYKGKTNAN